MNLADMLRFVNASRCAGGRRHNVWKIIPDIKLFLDVVSQTSFRNKAHFLWLDSVVDWKKFPKEFQAEYQRPYIIPNCLSCGTTFKDGGAGYWGKGKQGQLRGFYSETITPGYCSHFCAVDAGCYEDL